MTEQEQVEAAREAGWGRDWEPVIVGEQSQTRRLKAPGGWLVRLVADSGRVAAMAFVPDSAQEAREAGRIQERAAVLRYLSMVRGIETAGVQASLQTIYDHIANGGHRA